MTDAELLTEYLNSGSDECFAELVRRYMGLVFGTALRAMRNPAAAEEVSQQVFCALAMQARGIRNPAALATWLHRTTQRMAMMHFRTEQRRLDRERTAAEFQASTDDGLAWEELAPALDEAMSSLKETDRAALLLRFFQSKPIAEVAADLGVSEAAAKMRIGRAIETLRGRLSERGLACSAAGLLALVENRASVKAAPAAVERVVTLSLESVAAAKMAPGLAWSALAWPGMFAAGLVLALLLAWMFFTGTGTLRPTRKVASLSSSNSTTTALSAAAAARAKTPTAGASLRLTTLDAATGQPVPGVLVTASSVGKRLGQAATDRNGNCVLPRPSAAAGDFYYYIRTEMAGYVSMEVSWGRFQSDVLSDIPPEYVLRIPPGARVGGSVMDEAGQPVPDIPVRVRLSSGGSVPSREHPLLMHGGTELATTDQNGNWSFDRLPPQWNAVHFVVSTPEYQKADYVTDLNDESVPKELQIPLQLLLDERAVLRVHGGLRVAGFILNTSKEPIAGASLVQDLHFYEPWARSSAGLDGSFEILNAQPGPLKLLVQAPNYAPKLVALDLNSSVTKTYIVLEPGARVQGQVVNERGIPIPDAEVEVAQQGGPGQQFESNTRTDPNGYFGWDSAPASGFDAVVFKPSYESKHEFLKPDTTEIIAITPLVDKIVEVQGRVVDDQTLGSISVFRYSLSEDQHGFGPSRPGEDGTFVANVSGTSKWFTIEVKAAGYEPCSIGQPVSTNDSAQLTFRLHRSSGYAGVVLLPNGDPAMGAEVGISDGGRSLMLGDRRFLHQDQSIIRRTDASGRFQFGPRPPQMPSGRVLVAVHALGYAECDGDLRRSDIVLQLQPWGRVEGVLRCQGQPLAGENVFLEKRTWNPWLPIVDLQGPFWIQTDTQGRFNWEFVPPGDFAIGREPAHSLDVRATIQVHPGETVQIQVGGTGQPVVGRNEIPNFRTGFDFGRSSGLFKRQQADPVDLPWELRSDYPSEQAFQAAMVENGKRRLAYWQSDRGLAAWRQQLSYGIRFDPDGTFYADDVLPGDYILDVSLFELRPGSSTETRPVPPSLTSVDTVHVNPSSDQQTPADLGAVILKPRF